MGAKMAGQVFKVDLNRPLVLQVGHLGEAYQEWVHTPIVSKETPRFFENDVLEFFTRTAWWVIPLVWLPVICYFILLSVNTGLPTNEVATALVCGIIVWTLLEYVLHRFFFHMNTTSYWANTLHYLVHGCHHKHPMDGLRLVFPPTGAAILSLPLWCMIKLFASESYAPAVFGGGLLGYVIYDCTHYYLHYGKPMTGVSHQLKRNHMEHHFRIQDKGFGITSNFWDRVFGTTLPPKKSAMNSS